MGELLGSLRKTQVVFIAGNRDYLREDSSYRTFRFPENVHFLDGIQNKKIVFPELQTVVYGLSYTRKQQQEPLYESFRPEEEGIASIFLVHAGDGGAYEASPGKVGSFRFFLYRPGRQPPGIIPGWRTGWSAPEP